MIHSGYQASIQDASTLLYNLDDILKNEAKEVIHALLTDLRIFTATNFAIFFLIFLLTISVNAALLKALSLPAGLLTIADSIASFTYLFEQNWFYTILYNNYWGVGYIVFVGMLFSFLLDITFNKGKGTMNLLLAITGD